jgi:WD40 repeat protein
VCLPFCVRSSGTFNADGRVDGDIYVWGTETGKLLAKQKVHTPPCSCVAWNSKKHDMIASAGDDYTVRM